MSVDNQQTAVEWLHSKYIKIFGELNLSTAKLLEIAYALEQAKEMEKEQIIDAYENGVKETNSRCEYQEAEQYYNETFKSE